MSSQFSFKQTPIGPIPKEWGVASLGDKEITVELFYGITAKAVDKDTGVKMLRTTDIKEYSVDWEMLPFCEITERRGNLTKYLLKKGELIVARAGTVGVSILVDRDLDNVVFGSYLIKIRLKPTVDTKFVHYFFQSPLYWKHLQKAQGSTLKNINLPLLKSLKIPFPPPPEQRKIASILSTVDEAIQRVDEAIARTERLKRGLMQRLLTRGIWHKEFKDTEIGRIPKEWEVVRLCDIGMLKDGDWILKENYTPEGVRLIQIGDIGLGEFFDKSSRYISLERAKELNCTFIKPGEVLISRMPDPIGRACLAPELPYPAIVAVDITILKAKKEIAEPGYLVHILNSHPTLAKVKMLSSGATRFRISRRNLEEIKISLPPFPEQRRIAEILSTVDKKLELERKRKEKLEVIKRGLMSDLLMGRKRVRIAPETEGRKK
jgi:type I restriction enzyme S subunit